MSDKKRRPRKLRKAADPATPPADLVRIASRGKRDERALVAANPNTPLATLLELAEPFPDEVLRNPTFVLAQIADPALLAGLPWKVMLAIAASPALPPHAAAVLLRDDHWAPEDLLSPQYMLAGNPSCPPEVLRKLCSCQQSSVRALAARHPATPPDAIALLRRIGAAEDLSSTIPAPASEHDLRGAAELGYWARELVASHPDSPPALLSELFLDHPWLASRLATNPATPPELLLQIARQAILHARISMVQHGRLLVHPRLPAEGFSELAEHLLQRGHLEFLAEHVADNPRTPVPLLETLVEHFSRSLSLSSSLLVRLAGNPSLPASRLAQLCHLAPEEVCTAIARRADAPPSLLVGLTAAHGPSTRQAAFRNPSLPASWRERLQRLGFSVDILEFPLLDLPATDDDLEALFEAGWWYRNYLLRRAALPPSLLERLARAADPAQRRLLARRPGLPPELRRLLG